MIDFCELLLQPGSVFLLFFSRDVFMMLISMYFNNLSYLQNVILKANAEVCGGVNKSVIREIYLMKMESSNGFVLTYTCFTWYSEY